MSSPVRPYSPRHPSGRPVARENRVPAVLPLCASGDWVQKTSEKRDFRTFVNLPRTVAEGRSGARTNRTYKVALTRRGFLLYCCFSSSLLVLRRSRGIAHRWCWGYRVSRLIQRIIASSGLPIGTCTILSVVVMDGWMCVTLGCSDYCFKVSFV